MRNAVFLAAAAGLALGACTTGGGPGAYQSDYERLTAECREQGGVLIPTGGPITGNPATEYACERRTLQGQVN